MRVILVVVAAAMLAKWAQPSVAWQVD